MSELQRAIELEIASFTPERTPGLHLLTARRRARVRRGRVAAVLAVTGLVAGGLAVGWQRPEAGRAVLAAAAPGSSAEPGPPQVFVLSLPNSAVLNYKLPEQRDACLALPGVTVRPAEPGAEPGRYVVEVRGRDEIAAFRDCAKAVFALIVREPG